MNRELAEEYFESIGGIVCWDCNISLKWEGDLPEYADDTLCYECEIARLKNAKDDKSLTIEATKMPKSQLPDKSYWKVYFSSEPMVDNQKPTKYYTATSSKKAWELYKDLLKNSSFVRKPVRVRPCLSLTSALYALRKAKKKGVTLLMQRSDMKNVYLSLNSKGYLLINKQYIKPMYLDSFFASDFVQLWTLYSLKDVKKKDAKYLNESSI